VEGDYTDFVAVQQAQNGLLLMVVLEIYKQIEGCD